MIKVTDAYIRRLNAVCAAIDCENECLHVGYCEAVYRRERERESARRGNNSGVCCAVHSGHDGRL